MEAEARLQLAIRAACEVATRQGLTFERAIVLQHRSNAIVHLSPTAVVARVATTPSTVRQGDGWFTRAPKTVWQGVKLEGWYGGRTCELQVASDTAVWYHTGLPVVPIRWVLVKDPTGKLEPQAFLSTDTHATAEQILLWFRQRWQVEVTFEEVRAHLGVETQRQWSD